MRLLFTTLVPMLLILPAFAEDWTDALTHGHADSDGVKIHYVTMGEGPLVVMIHGFPDFWYTWRHQMPALAEDYQVVAMDQRGYNKSDQPEGQEQYDTALLVADVLAVVKHFGADRATIVGHDWGGFVAWSFAMAHPEACERLVVCNLTHPKGLARELATNPAQQASSAYAQAFQQPGAHKVVSKSMLAMSVAKGDPEALQRYTEAFERSDLEAMLHYYKQNYPQAPYTAVDRAFPPVQCPTLVFHGLADKALLPAGLNDTWDWIDAPLTLVTIPGADHWVHHDAAEYVTATLRAWLTLHAGKTE